MYRYLLLILLIIVPVLLMAQKKPDDTPQDMQIKGVVIAGMNASQVDGDEVYGFSKFGVNAGVGAIVPLGKNFSIGIETLYNQKGSYKKYSINGDSTGTPYYKLRLDYLDVPVLAYYEDRHIWTVGLGFSWGRRVNYKETIRGIDTTFSQYTVNGVPVVVPASHVPGDDTLSTLYPPKKNDWSVLISVHLRIWKHLKLNVRYSYSMANIGHHDYIAKETKDTWTRNMYNNVISLRLMYIINERYVPPPKEKKTKKKKLTAYTPPWNL
jgi:hypothetical protein